MRWQQLFADLQGQFEEHEAAADRAEWSSRARAEIGSVVLADRLRGALGSPLFLQCRGAGRVAGRLVEVGPDFVLLEDEQARSSLVATGAILAVSGLSRRTAVAEDAGPVRGRLDLRRALRALARDRAAVQPDPRRRPGAERNGRPGRCRLPRTGRAPRGPAATVGGGGRRARRRHRRDRPGPVGAGTVGLKVLLRP